MRALSIAICTALLFVPSIVHAQAGGGPGDGLDPDHLPYVDTIKSDWADRFETEDARQNFKQLREYRAEKQSAVAQARSQFLAIEGMLGHARANADNLSGAVARTSELLTGAGPRDTIVYVPWSFPYQVNQMLGFMTPGSVPLSALRTLQPRLVAADTAAQRRAAALQGLYGLTRDNIAVLETDVRRAEDAIDVALAPEYENQKFRKQVSLYFCGIIGFMIIAFFGTIYRRSGNDIGTLLLSDGGLQFVTIFVLIIAITLFGILNILEGRELAAILSGIAGYILGRGGRMKAADPPHAGQPAAPAPSPGAPPEGLRIPMMYPPSAGAQGAPSHAPTAEGAPPGPPPEKPTEVR